MPQRRNHTFFHCCFYCPICICKYLSTNFADPIAFCSVFDTGCFLCLCFYQFMNVFFFFSCLLYRYRICSFFIIIIVNCYMICFLCFQGIRSILSRKHSLCLAVIDLNCILFNPIHVELIPAFFRRRKGVYTDVFSLFSGYCCSQLQYTGFIP